MAEPKTKTGKVLTQETATTVKDFFTYVECSKMCACKEECVTVKVTDKKVKLRKHLLLSNIISRIISRIQKVVNYDQSKLVCQF